jgi:hypothetical protein
VREGGTKSKKKEKFLDWVTEWMNPNFQFWTSKTKTKVRELLRKSV